MTGQNNVVVSTPMNGNAFPNLRVASMHPESGVISWESAYIAKLVITRAGEAAPVIRMENQASGSSFMQCILSSRTASRTGAALFFITPLPGATGATLYVVQCPNKVAADQLQAALDAALSDSQSATTAVAAAAATAAVMGPGPSLDLAAAEPRGDPIRTGHPSVRTNGCYHDSHCRTRAGSAVATAGVAGPGLSWSAQQSQGPVLPPPSPGFGGPGGGSGGFPEPGPRARLVTRQGGSSGAEDGSGAGPGPPADRAVTAGRGSTSLRSPLHWSAAGAGGGEEAAEQEGASGGGSGCCLRLQTGQRSCAGDHGAGGRAEGGQAATAAANATATVAAHGEGHLNHFDRKICRASSDMYFHYYGMVQHQQNMLQDHIRMGTYYHAIVDNPDDFRGRVVMDVGAGSGILSLFAARAGAARVYAVEASGMARFARVLADANPDLGHRITVINSKVEEVTLPERVDVLISEPMGTLLVNERMLESYIYARDAFLKPDGKMFPQAGRIHAACFSDEGLYAEVAAKSAFWQQSAFWGVDVTALYGAATEHYFGQVVVDAFDPALLVTSCASKVIDFGLVLESELLNIEIPLQLVTHGVAPLTIHGLACWFDVYFHGSQRPLWLTTAPGMPTTHWFQLRCVLQQPLVVTSPNARITGLLHLVAHARQSYDIYVTLTAPPLQPGQPPQTSSGKFDLKEPYYRQLTSYAAAGVTSTVSGGTAQVVGEAAAAAAAAGYIWVE